MKPYQQNINCTNGRVKTLGDLETFRLNSSLYAWKSKRWLCRICKKIIIIKKIACGRQAEYKKSTVKEGQISKDDMSVDKAESESVKQVYCQSINWLIVV